VEYAGILRGAHNEKGAKELIDFMLSRRFQADVPGSMFVYPVRAGVPLPEAFAKHALVPEDPLSLPAAEIDANRDRWLAAWTDIVVR
jgi:thiamine transport system substrate-binding protein